MEQVICYVSIFIYLLLGNGLYMLLLIKNI